MSGRYRSRLDGDQSWRDRAACKGLDPEMFMAERGDTETVVAAKAIFATCPVREQCLDYAINNSERLGIWGGKADRERARIARERRQRGELPRLVRFTPINHGSGSSAYMRCKEANGSACTPCLEGHARQQREAKALRKERRAS